MVEYIGSIEIPEIVPSGVFPVVSEYGYGYSQEPKVVVHRFGSANAKIEQRFLLGNGAKHFTVRKSQMNETDREALRTFWETSYGPYGAFTYNAPDDDANGTTAYICRFANEPLSWEFLSDQISSSSVTLIEIPTTAPQYQLNASVTRFPSSTLKTGLLSQVQQVIPLVKIQPRESGYPAIYVSDRRCTVGAQLYLARLLDFDGISQSIGNEADEAQFTFGNADRVMRELANDTDLFRASIEFSLFHVGTGIKLDLWKGEIADWTLDQGPEFRVTAVDGIYELTLPYPTRRISRTCWKSYDDANGCPYTAQSTGLDTTHFPTVSALSCDKGYDSANGCLAHGMKRYFGGIICEPQSVRIKDNSQGVWGFGRPTITASSLVNDSVYDQVVQEIYTNNETYKDGAGDTRTGRLVNCKICAGRDESDFYAALGIVGEGPLTFGTGHKLDGQYNHLSDDNDYGREMVGSDPAGANDYFSLGHVGVSAGGDWRKAAYGGSVYKDNFSAGVAALDIRRNDEKGIQLGYSSGHEMQAVVLTGMHGWIWTATNTRTWEVLTNPIWIAVNMMLRARGLRYASATLAEQYFVLANAIAAADICDLTVTPLMTRKLETWVPLDYDEFGKKIPGYWVEGTVASETQFVFQGTLSEQKPLRDWIQEVLMNCLGYFSFSFGKLDLGVRTNSGAVEAFTEGNILLDSLQLSPLKPTFNHLTASFGDAEFNYSANSVEIYDIDNAKLIGGATAPLYLKSQMNLSGVSNKSQAARIISTRLREELGGINATQWKAARRLSFATTVLALNTNPGMICSMTHDEMPDGVFNETPTDDYGEFRIMSWRLNKDFSITIEGQATVNEMYDLVDGPKPADVAPDAVPVETIYGTHVPSELYINGIDPSGRVVIGLIAKKWTDTIYEGEIRAKFYANDTPPFVDMRTPEEGGTFMHDGTTQIIAEGLFASPEGGLNYTFKFSEHGRWYYAGRLRNKSGWSVWSDGNDRPTRVRDFVTTEGETAADIGPPSGSTIQVQSSIAAGSVVVKATRPATNAKTVLSVMYQIRDGNQGEWRELDDNAGAAVTYYDGSGVDHIWDKSKGTITSSSGFGTATTGMILFDVRNSSAFDRDYCLWGIITSINGNVLTTPNGFAPVSDPDTGSYIYEHIRIKIVKPPWEWNTEGYFGDSPGRGYSVMEYFNGGQQGDKTSQVFSSFPIEIPSGMGMGNIKARAWFWSKYSIAECGRTDSATLIDTGNPSGAHDLTILTHDEDASIPPGQMALQFYRDTANYKNIWCMAFMISPSLPANGPYKAERDAHPTRTIETGTCTITAGSMDVTVTRASDTSVVGAVLVIYTNDATPDDDIDANAIEAQGTDSLTLYANGTFGKSGTFAYAIVESYWPGGASGTDNTAVPVFQVPEEIGGDIESEVWRTPPISMPAGHFYVSGLSRNPIGLGTEITADSDDIGTGGGEFCVSLVDGAVISTNAKLSGQYNEKTFMLSMSAPLEENRLLATPTNAVCGRVLNYCFDNTGDEEIVIDLDAGFSVGQAHPELPGPLDIVEDSAYDPTAFTQYFGDPDTDGTWRTVRSGNNLVFERRETGSWVTKQTISA